MRKYRGYMWVGLILVALILLKVIFLKNPSESKDTNQKKPTSQSVDAVVLKPTLLNNRCACKRFTARQ
jgi:hypothetical protein